ncbi:hypothetical protein ACFXDO_20045 [Streptomyces nigra]|uniref:hypothetical protein n=1 Tax=Streptomyces nigra TaxID=1827580 RepID=UPI0036B549A9
MRDVPRVERLPPAACRGPQRPPPRRVPAGSHHDRRRRRHQVGRRPLPVNWAMHFGRAALLGVPRSVMARAGLRGPAASAKFTVVRVTNVQILENATGVGAPPATWPRAELVVDLLHKIVYGFATGLVADALAAHDGLGPGQRHAAAHPGRRTDAGPLPREAAHTR